MSSGVAFGLLTPEGKEKVLANVAKESAHREQIYVDAITRALEFRTIGPEERLKFYQDRLPEVWEALAGYSPKLLTEQQEDWANLERNRMNKTISAYNPFVTNDVKTGGMATLAPEGLQP